MFHVILHLILHITYGGNKSKRIEPTMTEADLMHDFTDERLIACVKNAKTDEYTEHLRQHAINILRGRGIAVGNSFNSLNEPTDNVNLMRLIRRYRIFTFVAALFYLPAVIVYTCFILNTLPDKKPEFLLYINLSGNEYLDISIAIFCLLMFLGFWTLSYMVKRAFLQYIGRRIDDAEIPVMLIMFSIVFPIFAVQYWKRMPIYLEEFYSKRKRTYVEYPFGKGPNCR